MADEWKEFLKEVHEENKKDIEKSKEREKRLYERINEEDQSVSNPKEDKKT